MKGERNVKKERVVTEAWGFSGLLIIAGEEGPKGDGFGSCELLRELGPLEYQELS